jgi:hypothetical protein
VIGERFRARVISRVPVAEGERPRCPVPSSSSRWPAAWSRLPPRTPDDHTTPGERGVGARSAGDRLFPQIGNGGYDALHYDLRLAYDPATKILDGRATMTARATQRLRASGLDLQGFEVTSVSVDGGPRRSRARRPSS